MNKEKEYYKAYMMRLVLQHGNKERLKGFGLGFFAGLLVYLFFFLSIKLYASLM